MVSSQMIKELREKTGAGIMDCKKALIESDGDIEKATVCLKEQGYRKLESKANRIVKEGTIEPYVHLGGKLGVLVEINCETDFVAKNSDFKSFSHDVAMQIAATNPIYINKDDVPKEVTDEIAKEEIESFYKENCLLEQSFIKDESTTIRQLLIDLAAKIGENIRIRRFVRYELGQGD